MGSTEVYILGQKYTIKGDAPEEYIKEIASFVDKKLKDAGKKLKTMPWEMPEVNKRVIKAFNLRLPEPEFLKLKYVIEKTKAKSLHSFCVEVVKKEVEKQLKKLAK